MTRITEAAKIEKIVDYYFERNEKSNVLAIHPTLPLIAYLINIQRTQKISKAWSSGNDSLQSPSSSSINGQNNNNSNNTSFNNSTDKNKTVSIRIIDYATRQRCLAKGIYHARPADCVFTINSLLCTQAEVIKMAVVDRLANIYLYDISYFISDLTATRIAVIRGPGEIVSPYESIILVWCPFVPCEDFDDGDGGLRLALATDSKIEIFAVDRLQGRTGEMSRKDLKGAYKCIQDAHKTNIATLSISPDCSTISAAALDNRVTFLSSDIHDTSGEICLHNWEAKITDNSSISRLFFLDDYPKLLEDSTMNFWGSAFIGTRKGQMLLVDLKEWSVYQIRQLGSPMIDWPSGKPNFDYRIDLTSRSIVAMWDTVCYVVQLASVNSLPEIVKVTRLSMPSSIYSFVIKRKSESSELELFTISAYSLERYIINLNSFSRVEEEEDEEEAPLSTSVTEEVRSSAKTPHELKRFLQQFDGSLRISSSGNSEANLLNTSVVTAPSPIKQQDMDLFNLMNSSMVAQSASQRTSNIASAPVLIPAQVHSAGTIMNNNNNNTNINNINNSNNSSLPKSSATNSVDVVQMDRMVEALFTKLNTAFSQGLDEFLGEIKCEVNDLKLRLNGLCKDVRKLQQQLQETRQK